MMMPPAPPPEPEGTLRDIRSIVDTELSRLRAEDLLTVLLVRVKKILDADTAAVLLLDPSGRFLVATAASGLEEEVRQGVRIPVGYGFAGRIAADRRPLVLDHADPGNVLNPILLQKGIRSVVGVPLLVNQRVIGVLHVGSVGQRVFTEEDVALLQIAAERAALAVHSVTTRDDRVAAAALQRGLLPTTPPPVEGVEISTRYVPGDGKVGGDWYDAFLLPSGKLGLVIGDVAGSGLAAAVIMGRIRSSLRSYALEFADPGEVLSRLDRKIQWFEGEAMATVLYAVLDPASGELRVSSAGHFPPVVAVPGEPAALASVALDVPIGVADPAQRPSSTMRLAPGTVVCFFTDGLVERRDKALDDRLSRLCEVVSSDPPGRVCGSVMAALVGSAHVSDDIALLSLRWNPEIPASGLALAK